jgi:transcriptional regulator with XRE-family HTH domain
MKTLSRTAIPAAVAISLLLWIARRAWKATAWTEIADTQLMRISYIWSMEAKEGVPAVSATEDQTPGELLRQARIRHELSQQQLAIRAGTTQSAIARIERDRVSPTIKTLTALFQAMEEDFVFGARPRDWGVDLTLNHKNLEFTPTQRLERGLGFSDVVREIQGETLRKKAA